MTKDPHFPFWISSLDSVVRKDLFELESVFRQCDVVGLGVPFLETTELMTVAELSAGQSLSPERWGNILDKKCTTSQDIEVRVPSFKDVTDH